MTHTPRPWKKEGLKVTAAGHGVICVCPVVSVGGTFNVEANARLIATAPRMFEVLEEMAAGSCCQTPGCNIDDPMCDTMVARYAIEGIYDKG